VHSKKNFVKFFQICFK